MDADQKAIVLRLLKAHRRALAWWIKQEELAMAREHRGPQPEYLPRLKEIADTNKLIVELEAES